MLYFNVSNINNDQDLTKIVGKIVSSLNSLQDKTNKVLVVKIQEVTRDDSTMIPKLEYKNS